MNVFVRYRRINDEWKDVDIRQARISLDLNATIDTLINHLGNKWSINPNELLVRVYDKDFGEFTDIDSDPETVELQNLTKYEIVHRVGKWARKEPQKPPSVSTTVSEEDNDVPSTSSYTPPSLKNEIIEIDTDEIAAAAAAAKQLDIAVASSHIEDISTRALSMFATTSGISHTRATSQPTQSTTTTALTTTGIPSMTFNLNVIEQLEKSEYGRQCLDHFEELSHAKDLFLSNGIKVKFVNIIGQWLMLNCRQCGQPSAEERRNFVSFCLGQLPCELNPDIFTNKDGTGTLDNYVKNKRQASKKRDGYLLMAAAAKKPRIDATENVATENNATTGGTGAAPAAANNAGAGTGNGNNAANINNNSSKPASPNENNGVGDAIHEKDIFEMASMDSSRFIDKIIEKHTNTLKYRRKWIEETLKKDITIRNKIAHMILTRFPQMTRINALISIDFDYIVKKRFPNWSAKSLAREWEEVWSKKILHYALNNGNSFAVNALKDYGLEKIPSISEEDRCIFSLRLLPSLMQGKGTKVTGSDADSLITEIKQENRSIVAAIESVRKNMQITCPLILQVTSYRNPAGEPEFESSYFILIEETAIPVDGDFSRALELLIQCYYTLEISYPSRLHGVYRLLEYFYGIQSMRRTSCFIQFIDILEKCPT